MIQPAQTAPAKTPLVRAKGLFSRLATFLFMAALTFGFAAMPVRAELPPYAAIVVDAHTGKVFHAKDADQRRYPASLTKMMTLYLTFEALEKGRLRLDQKLKVSSHAAGQPPSRLGLRPGQTITVENAIMALVTKSANDAAVVLAEALGQKEWRFAQTMTAKARDLGMTRTVFRNASGLPNRSQVSSARDMATLSAALIRDFPDQYRYFSHDRFTYGGQVYGNHNKLLGAYDGVDGIKTGYIRDSGFNLSASAVRNGRRLIAVVFGGPSGAWRDERVASLLDEGFAKAGPAPLLARLGDLPRPPVKPASTAAAAVASNLRPPPLERKFLKRVSVGDPRRTNPRNEDQDDVFAAGWGIQVGAFNDRDHSERVATRIAADLSDLMPTAVPQVLEVQTDKGTIYRARLMGLDEDGARMLCAKLETDGKGCLPVPPHQGL